MSDGFQQVMVVDNGTERESSKSSRYYYLSVL